MGCDNETCGCSPKVQSYAAKVQPDDGQSSFNYVKSATTTESPVTPELVARLTNPNIINMLCNDMHNCIENAQYIDLLKKHIFYGKPIEENDREECIINDALVARISDPDTVRLLHAGIGMVTEAGEFLEMLLKHIYYGEPLDIVNGREEVGDSLWYIAIATDVLKTTMNEIMTVNINKLKARYPEKFTEFHAENRDLKTERDILEGN